MFTLSSKYIVQYFSCIDVAIEALVIKERTMSRKVCNSCGQELSHAAYYRHLNGRYGQACPAKYQKHDNLDSTFDFGSSSYDFDHDSDAKSNNIDDLESSLVSTAVQFSNNVLSDSEELGNETSEQ